VTPRLPVMRDPVKKLIIGALLVAIACLPSLAQAEAMGSVQVAAAGEIPGTSVAAPAQPDVSPGSTLDYAAREAAAPQLGGFVGGGSGIYIGSGALAVALLVVIIILVVR